MSVASWLDHISNTPQEVSSIPSLNSLADDDKENCRPVQPFVRSLKRKRGHTKAMEDNEKARKGPSRRTALISIVPPLPPFHADSSAASSTGTVESHQSGRVSPTKQMTLLQDAEEPTEFYDFGWPDVDMAEDAEILRDRVQSLADNRGILGHTRKELAHLAGRHSPLHLTERKRFAYPEAYNPSYSQQLGAVVPIQTVQNLVRKAMACETDRAHELTWNEKIHSTLINMALESSRHAQKLDICTLKTASVDPKDLIPADLYVPKRVVDYAFVLKPDPMIAAAFKKLQPLPPTQVKSWNNVTMNEARSKPIAINIETKAPNKSWTDGKPQLGIWIKSLLTRLSKLPGYRSRAPPVSEDLAIPSMPLIIAQGHDWHLLIVSQLKDQETGKRRTLIWQKLDIGSTRTCFDTYKVIAVLHLLAGWAENTWRPWFHGVIA